MAVVEGEGDHAGGDPRGSNMRNSQVVDLRPGASSSPGVITDWWPRLVRVRMTSCTGVDISAPPSLFSMINTCRSLAGVGAERVAGRVGHVAVAVVGGDQGVRLSSVRARRASAVERAWSFRGVATEFTFGAIGRCLLAVAGARTFPAGSSS